MRNSQAAAAAAAALGASATVDDVHNMECAHEFQQAILAHQNVSNLTSTQESSTRSRREITPQGLGLEPRQRQSIPVRLGLDIDKTRILDEYTSKYGDINAVCTKKQGKRIIEYLHDPPNNARLVRDHKMKPSLKKQYRVGDLTFNNVAVDIVRDHEKYGLSTADIKGIASLNKIFSKMVPSVLELRNMDTSQLLLPRLDYQQQTKISTERVKMMTAELIQQSMHPGMLVRKISGEISGETRELDPILEQHVDASNLEHMKRILVHGCPYEINYEEESDHKTKMLMRGNQKSLEDFPEVVDTTMNKEEKFGHVLAVEDWVPWFSPFSRVTPQGLIQKPGKNPRLVWDGSTKRWVTDQVLNEITSTDFEAVISFGLVKIKLYIAIYNWRISFPNEDILLAMADIKACFRFPRIHADVTGAFGFQARGLYFLATSMVFGSNTSSPCWEPFRRAIETMSVVFFEREDLVEKHAEYLDMIGWRNELPAPSELVQATKCEMNPGVLDENGRPSAPQANIYVDDALLACVGQLRMKKALAATIEAIFVVMGQPKTEVRQNPLAMDKWVELVVGSQQIMLGLDIRTRQLDVGIPPEYLAEVRELLDSEWSYTQTTFRVENMQRLVGKIARLGEGAHWIYKIMTHLYFSLAFALKQNGALLMISSPEFKKLSDQLATKQFRGKPSDIAKHVCFAMKKAAQMKNRAKYSYKINPSMRQELDFIRQALEPDSGIEFRTPIALLIPRMPFAKIFGDSSLGACGGYSIDLRFWWHLQFPDQIRRRTLIHKKNPDVSINALEFFTVIINYCAARVAMVEDKPTQDPHPVVLNVTDNTSALNWTIHTSKESLVGRTLARFFCGLLIGSPLGINSKWISTDENEVADRISRINKPRFANSPNYSYDYQNLKQSFPELKTCRFFQPSHKLRSHLWQVLLGKPCPPLKEILGWRPSDFGRLST